MDEANNVPSTPQEKIQNAKASMQKKVDKLKYIKQRIASAKRAKNKQRLQIAQIDYELCKLDIEKLKKKIEKEKIKMN